MTDFYRNWFYKNILGTINNNKFSSRNKIGEFKYIRIKDLVNNIKKNAMSKISAKKGWNELSRTKNTEIIKHKRCAPEQKELLDFFNNLSDTILTDKTLKSESQEDKKKNENDNTLISSKDENKISNKNENDNTLMSSKDEKEIKIKMKMKVTKH